LALGGMQTNPLARPAAPAPSARWRRVVGADGTPWFEAEEGGESAWEPPPGAVVINAEGADGAAGAGAGPAGAPDAAGAKAAPAGAASDAADAAAAAEVGAAISEAFPRGARALRFFFGWDPAHPRVCAHPRPWAYFAAAVVCVALDAVVYVRDGRRAADLQSLLTDVPKLAILVVAPFILRLCAQLAPLAPAARSYAHFLDAAPGARAAPPAPAAPSARTAPPEPAARARAPPLGARHAFDNRLVDAALALVAVMAVSVLVKDFTMLDYFAGAPFASRSALAQAAVVYSVLTAVGVIALLLVCFALLVLTLRLHTQWARVLFALYASRDAALARGAEAAGGADAAGGARAAAAAWWRAVLAGAPRALADARDFDAPASPRAGDAGGAAGAGVDVDHVLDAYDALRAAVADAALWAQVPILVVVAGLAFLTLVAALSVLANGSPASVAYFLPFLFVAPAGILLVLAPVVAFNTAWASLARGAKARAWAPAERTLLQAHFDGAPLVFAVGGVALTFESLAKLVGSALTPLVLSGALSVKNSLAAAIEGNATAAGAANATRARVLEGGARALGW